MILMLSSLSAALAAPDFDAGSDGSYGPLLVTAGNTLQVTLPPDGVIRATDITVETGGVLRFQTNTNNTPVYLLAQGDIRIDGTLDIAGRPATADVGGFAGPGGWSGGAGAQTGNIDARPKSVNADPELLHLVGGVGGNGDGDAFPNCGGGGGGGALLMASDTRVTIAGAVLAGGGSAQCPDFLNDPGAAGYGGNVRIVAPVVDGSGAIDTLGGDGLVQRAGYLRIDTLLPAAYTGLDFNGGPPGASGRFSSGYTMMGMLPVVPQARILSVAGQTVATESGAVSVTLGSGDPRTQDVVVQVTGLQPSGTVSVRVEQWKSGMSNATATDLMNLDLSTGDTVTIPVTFEPLTATWLTAVVRP
ncbi:MAG: hypothetical protein H6737_22680 [Alphaproteobacteria bacterium]|nr:hypothetical protein [Alphaproteobacteria bacterium]